MRKFNFAFIIMIVLGWQTARATTNICTITINSSDEINIFKKFYSSSDYKFIELTNLANQASVDSEKAKPSWFREDWFAKVCSQDISCDVLIISSHQWEGSFFGENQNKPFRISTDLMRKNQCQNSCANVLGHLQQVYLFGCNTLTSQDGDYDSFEKYMQYLAYDSHSHDSLSFQPEAHSKFSRAAISNQNSMRMIFSGVPQIFGFERRSPLGFMVSPKLESFFKNNSESNLKLFLTGKNTKLADKFSNLMKADNMILRQGFEKIMKPTY